MGRIAIQGLKMDNGLFISAEECKTLAICLEIQMSEPPVDDYGWGVLGNFLRKLKEIAGISEVSSEKSEELTLLNKVPTDEVKDGVRRFLFTVKSDKEYFLSVGETIKDLIVKELKVGDVFSLERQSNSFTLKVLKRKCHYCDNLAVKTLVWLKDKNRNPARIKLSWCGCDLQAALKRFWHSPYKVMEGFDYEVNNLEILEFTR